MKLICVWYACNISSRIVENADKTVPSILEEYSFLDLFMKSVNLDSQSLWRVLREVAIK